MCSVVKNKSRKGYLSWDEYFMQVSKLTAMRSKDPNTQVGACIVSNDNRILSIGYNDTPNGYSDDIFPCNECAKAIIQSGIKEVIYLCDKYKDTDGVIASKKMFDICGVKYRQIELNREITIK